MAIERQYLPQKWYYSRQEIEEHSPSRKDGIDLHTEMTLRKLYCSFLQELGMELKVPQQSIATAIMFCHRFYLRQSHAKNDWQTIAAVCMFLACKVEETPCKINNFVVEAYKKMFKWDPHAPQRIKYREVFDQQKYLILIGERMLLATIAYDMNLEHPYKPLVAALKTLNISDREISKIAWNFVNDCLWTTLCLQYKPRYVAAGSLFLAAKLLGVKLPIQKGTAWWLQFDVSLKQLEEVVQEMVTLLNKNKQLPPSSMAFYSPNSCTINGTHVGNTASLPERTSQESNSGTTTVSVAEDDNGEPRDVESYQKPSCKRVSYQCVAQQLDTKQIRGRPIKRQRCENEVR